MLHSKQRMSGIRLIALLAISVFPTSVSAFTQDTPVANPPTPTSQVTSKLETTSSGAPQFISDVCVHIEKSAKRAELPAGFLAKLIWKESRFDPNAISPAGAEGIAQFMPYTADTWGLENAFEPLEAISASSRLLGYLAKGYGNLGLAAAAYNAGEKRVDAWRRGQSRLPAETRNYVYSITGHRANVWKKGTGPDVDYTLDETKDFQSACEEFRQIEAPLQRRFANTYYNRALKLSQNGDYKAALLRYSTAIRLKPNFPHAYNNRGLVYRKLGRFEDAILNYNVAIAKAPNYANAYNNRGYANRKLKRYKAAIADYDRAIELKPGHATAWFNRGFSKNKLGLYEEAISDYTQSLKLSPGHPLFLYNRALAFIALERTEQAKKDLDAAINAHGSFAKAYYQRAALMFDMGMTDLAKSDYKKAIVLNVKYGHEKYRRRFE
ncbi:tetratricopeptide repeat protein [Labrenzia sp. PHM005]|uniref:tetratricopeptide repeat protein n=1 Tax=Labrenzia sp. PHM005 TaxID=2590016 RepID=UPI00114069B4|nr:tetratricopeptide repeat protein [Labrenzia sp. PHM005]QDG78497.1 tetratricopeptide repeat protein [Labrenzia sp. PHM005]